MFCPCFATEEQLLDKKLAKEISTDFRKEEQIIKLLLLGAGGCGKSTLFKQMKIIHQNGYTQEELIKQKEVLCNNILDIFHSMLWYAEENEIEILYSEDFIEDLKELNYSSFKLNDNMASQLQELWNDKGIKECYKHRHEYDIVENTEYFIKKIKDIANPDYVPTTEDVLKSRVKTIGISEKEFTVKKVKFKMVDVGGQRNERRKWIHAFDNVTCVLFVTSLSEYDQVLAEEDTQNRTEESMQLFQEICNHHYFRTKPIIVFFNKSDLFEEKIKVTPISIYFKDYKGDPRDKEESLKHIKQKFIELNTNRKRQIFAHVTNATDTNCVKLVFDVVRACLLDEIMNQSNIAV